MNDIFACMLRATQKTADRLSAGGPGSGPQGGGGGKESYPTQSQSDKAVAQSNAEIATARQELNTAMARDIAQDPAIQSLQKRAAELDTQRAEVIRKADEKKAAIVKKYEAKKAAAEAMLAQRMKDAGL